MLVKTMNQAYDMGNQGNLTLYVDGIEWGVVTQSRVKYGNVVIQWVIDDCRFFNVDEDKLYRLQLELK